MTINFSYVFFKHGRNFLQWVLLNLYYLLPLPFSEIGNFTVQIKLSFISVTNVVLLCYFFVQKKLSVTIEIDF